MSWISIAILVTVVVAVVSGYINTPTNREKINYWRVMRGRAALSDNEFKRYITIGRFAALVIIFGVVEYLRSAGG